jgi:hypothetical protein
MNDDCGYMLIMLFKGIQHNFIITRVCCWALDYLKLAGNFTPKRARAIFAKFKFSPEMIQVSTAGRLNFSFPIVKSAQIGPAGDRKK